jgi:hypothetical protein
MSHIINWALITLAAIATGASFGLAAVYLARWIFP